MSVSVNRPGSRTPTSDYGSTRHRASGSVASSVRHSRSDTDGHRDAGSSTRHSQSKPRSTGVESNVTRLLVAIKKLLEGLTHWSEGTVADAQISDMYVRLGNDFNAAVIAFDSFGIDMGELRSVPDDLRDILERCLAEEASPENLALYLPGVRKIITQLLEGLRVKQDMYRLRVGTSSSRSSRASRSELAYNNESGPADDSGTQTPRSSTSRTRAASSIAGESTRSRRPAESRRGVSTSDGERWSNSTSPRGSNIPVPPIPQAGEVRPGLPRTPSQKRSQLSRSATATPAPSDTDPETPTKKATSRSATSRQASGGSPTKEADLPAVPMPDIPKTLIPPDMPRYSLTDVPTAPSIAIEASSPQEGKDIPRPETPEAPPTPGMESSLAALKQTDVLQRRASKRFSTYTMSKMAGSGGSGPSNALRRSMAAGSLLTAGDLAALTEVDEGAEEAIAQPRPRNQLGRKKSFERKQRQAIMEEPPVPSLPSSETATNSTTPATTAVNGVSNHDRSGSATTLEVPDSPREMTVYFQVGRQVKKVLMEPVNSFAALRVLFMNKFLYNPGKDNFPEIYIRDPASGVQYELEDLSEIKDKCLLSLNIEPLDQIKQHIDTQIANITQEIKDLKSSVSASRRISLPNGSVAATPATTPGTLVSRPSEKQFQAMAQRIGKAQTRGAVPMAPLVAQLTGQSDTGSVVSSRIVADLKTQFDEVQNIRRDLGVMRQIYVDFTNSTKDSIAQIRQQTNSVRQVANAKVGGARASINSGKARLDKRSQDVLTKIEDLQDTVENLKEDVLKRHVTPQMHKMKEWRKDIDSTTKELEDLKSHIATIRPAWKKTWEQELQNIVEEQQFLSHQEELIEDLLEDHKALVEVFGHVEKVISIRGSGGGRARGFRPPPPEEGHNGLSTVMLEIRGARGDPEKRLKAIEQNEKARQKELASRPDEFQEELHGFVAGKKLKMTGGAEEVERVRQVKDDLAFKAMFSSGSSLSAMGGGAGGMSVGGMTGGLPGLATAPPIEFSDDEDMSPINSPI